MRLFRRRKSVLFIRPDYHCSFFYRDELRKLGWKADIYVSWGYPRHLLYSDKDIRRPKRGSTSDGLIGQVIRAALASVWYLMNGWKYEFHLYYGKPPEWLNVATRFNPRGTPLLSLWLAKLWGCKLIFLPSGCNEQLSKKAFEQLDSGSVCKNCGFWDRCSDADVNVPHFARIKRYFDMTIGNDPTPESAIPVTTIKWKSVGLDLWKPDLDPPKELRLPESQSLRILHSFSSNGRDFEGRNIKGSPFVRAAVDRLISEGHDLEFIFFSDVPSNQMRFYQAQADIVVEQLRYGWWGSTGVETMALGKPIVCYLRPSWKEFFFQNFPEYEKLPVIEATVDTIYDSLKLLVENEDFRIRMGEESRSFAEKHFNPRVNALSLERHLLDIH